ncbi:hypothetical protein LOC68_21050 [Blastopirellula sp. JC732]|uniref:Uncharacterized protein n=1 Tax=Blastopirellula sediminis TaxID=2894196 RepID=A0A9X1MQI3_9BACT|nr:hypothetical protein [Blastopirellula sediminis]MCC9605814.1 hypothetical protein [Blastopirellula sediminis]MCC9630886.1 hypothetical protein [Blastopirellula sediminis]
MTKIICIVLCSVHLLAMGISTLIAAYEIESILVTGVICTATGIISGISALVCGRWTLAAVGFMAPAIAASLVILENSSFHLGPQRAALPFTIIFLINQAIALPTMLVQLRLMLELNPQASRQITLRTLMISVTAFAVCSAIARLFLQSGHGRALLMTIALGLVGLTIVGLGLVVYSAIRSRRGTEELPEREANPEADAMESPFDD